MTVKSQRPIWRYWIATPSKVIGGRYHATGTVLLGVLCMFPWRLVSADAETSNVADSRNPNQLQEIVVTAQKREERLQDVPMAVSVISADELLQNHEIYLRDYMATVPGVSFRDDGGPYSQIIIRGLSSDVNPTVGITIDDVPVGLTNAGAVFGSTGFVPQLDPADLERIEVLKGPQGTLYGASSIGGVLRYVTAPPDLTSIFGRAEIDGSTIPSGGGNGYGVRGAANIPIIADTFAIRVSAFHREDPGFYNDPTHQLRNFNTAYVTGGRLDSLWQITPDFSVRVAGLIEKNENVGGGVGGGGGGVDTAYSTGTLYYSPIYGDLVTHNMQPGAGQFELEHQLYNATVKLHTNWFDVTSITGLGSETFDSTANWTPIEGPAIGTSMLLPAFAPLCPCGAIDPLGLDSRKFTQELRLASLGKTFDWVVGAFYTDENTPGGFNLEAAYLDSGVPIPGGQIYAQAFHIRYHEYAGFADLKFHFSSQFDVEVGARRSHNWQDNLQETATGAFGGPGAAGSSTDNSFTYQLSPQFRFSDSFMAYARVASGYMAGGPNVIGLGQVVPLSFGPAKSTNYELGVKGSFFERRATVNADIYDIQWTDVQLSATDLATLTGYTFNGGDARSRGVETEIKLLPVDSLTISASAAFTDAILTQGVSGVVYGRKTTGEASAGDWLPYGSRWSGSLSAERRFVISSSATGFAGATWAYVGKRYSDYNSFNPDSRQSLWPGYNYTNARVGARWDGYTLTAFVNNVTNSRGIVQAVPTNPALVAASVTTPRMVGLSVVKEFK